MNSGRYSATELPNGQVVRNRSPANLEAAADLARQSGTKNTIVTKKTNGGY